MNAHSHMNIFLLSLSSDNVPLTYCTAWCLFSFTSLTHQQGMRLGVCFCVRDREMGVDEEGWETLFIYVEKPWWGIAWRWHPRHKQARFPLFTDLPQEGLEGGMGGVRGWGNDGVWLFEGEKYAEVRGCVWVVEDISVFVLAWSWRDINRWGWVGPSLLSCRNKPP